MNHRTHTLLVLAACLAITPAMADLGAVLLPSPPPSGPRITINSHGRHHGRHYGRYRSRASVKHYANQRARQREETREKERKERWENAKKQAARAAETEMWNRELRGVLPAGYGSGVVANMSEESKKLLEKKLKAKEAEEARLRKAHDERRARLTTTVIDDEALTQLKRISDYLGGLKAFELQAEDVSERVITPMNRYQVRAKQRYTFARPSRFHLSSQGDDLAYDMWCNGKRAVFRNRATKTELEIPVSGDMEDIATSMYQQHDFVLPLVDLLIEDLYTAGTMDLVRARYLGQTVMNGQKCHHISATAGDVDWELWIRTGDTPAPVRAIFRYRSEMGAPRYAANITALRPLSAVDERAFKPTSN